MNHLSPGDRIAGLIAALESARATALAGTPLDLAGLETATEEAMAAVAAAPAGARASLLGALAQLIAALDLLSAALSQQHQADLRPRAVAAYGGELAASAAQAAK